MALATLTALLCSGAPLHAWLKREIDDPLASAMMVLLFQVTVIALLSGAGRRR